MNPVDDTGAIQAVTSILGDAWRCRASDVHLEPRPQAMRVRYRVDGMLTDRRQVPGPLVTSIVNRLKVLGGLDIAEKRLPQDGSFRQTVESAELVVRVSSFPTEYGEKLVLRLLAERREVPSLNDLGMSTRMAEQLRAAARRPNGLVLVTGPTGSGKTSTMYALVRELERADISIVTLEDPIEYRFPSVTQGQTNNRAGFTFAAGLRAVLRQDPNVIMVGEMRDAETASIACTAALTGHMVISSLHTNSVAETFVRLNDIGIERYVVAASLRVIVNQRLVRRLCESCRKPVAASDADRRLMYPTVPPAHLWEPKGCARCNGAGYYGRVGVFEMAEMDDDLGEMLKTGASRQEFGAELGRRGIKPIRMGALEAAAAGHTSLAEALRVT